MPEVVKVSSLENMEKLRASIEERFKKGQYAEITQAIGMHSLIIDPEHTLRDQAGLYRLVLNLIKEQVNKGKGRSYGAWYASFPKLMDELISTRQIVTDASCLDALLSRREAFGPFKSLDDFFAWALDDRRMNLDEIMKYIGRTVEMHKA